ncbi:Thiosulfate sulfurtransferase/rhodanese-like domain-containing protein 3 isoform X2 [Oopsacas minuta]|uniref:Thiosulfate sulfurtransferase/rhodanese-like domain-containing protein 3 isoform X2 n=1 Tax=Oopsacas minuta TaxID=111878 RepID=A0AAV7JUV4_9METZ|nr:Thiosulfate sulfurtransferase/rhodanese-like domain-containing protein 3 isoform X2 [Oopsacas minuta]
MFVHRSIVRLIRPIVVYQFNHYRISRIVAQQLYPTSSPTLIQCITSLRLLSTISEVVPFNVSHEELLNKLESGDLTLIDVREKGEIAINGFIMGSIAISLGNLQTALSYDDDKFKEIYGVDKPRFADEIIFMCHAGVRSKLAAKIARAAGFTLVREYADGWSGWEKRINLK